MTITVAAYNRAGTHLVDLPDSFERTWQDQRSDTGSASLKLPFGDPALASIPYRSILRYSLNGTVRFAALVEKITRAAKAQGEEKDQNATLKGRGTLAVLEEAVIYPQGGIGFLPFTDTRLFSYATPAFDDSGWGTATTIKVQGSTAAPYSGSPANWPDPAAEWIWGQGGAAPYPVGDCYFRKSFTLASEATIRFFASADDGIQVYIDGALVLNESQAYLWDETRQADVFLASGSHTVAIRGTNVARPSSPSTNVAAVIACGFVMNPDGTMGSEVFSTTSAWKASAYPTLTPAPTPGWIITTLLSEAQTRGALSGVTTDATSTLDSAGNAWVPAGEFAWPVGTDYLTAFKAMAGSWIDIAMDPASLTLHAYNALGASKSVGLGGVNLTSLTHDGQA